MIPSIGTQYLLGFLRWLERSKNWQCFFRLSPFGRAGSGEHAKRVALWAKSDYKAWRAATFAV